MSKITQAANRHQTVVHDAFGTAGAAVAGAAKAVKENVYDPATSAVRKLLGEEGKLVIEPNDTFTHQFSAIEEVDKAEGFKAKVEAGRQYIRDAEGRKGKIKAGLKVYDTLISTYGEKASKEMAGGAYYLTKVGLEVLTGSLISRSKAGKAVQEGLATAVGGLARLITKVAEYALRLLPYIVAAAAVVGAGLGIAALAVSGQPLTAIIAGLALMVVIQQVQIRFLRQDKNELARQVDEMRKRADTPPAPSLLGRAASAVSSHPYVATAATAAVSAAGYFVAPLLRAAVGI